VETTYTIWQYLFTLPVHEIPWWAEVFRSILRVVIGLAFGLGLVPIYVWLERRMLGWVQGRLGPNRVGPEGLLQPIADVIKLFMKEDIIPTNVDRGLFLIAPIIALAPVIMSITVIPWNGSKSWGAVAPGLDIGILFLLGVASIEVYGVILAGWSSNNKYSLLGGLRASSQVISYELGMGLAIIAVLLMCGTLGLQDVVRGYDLRQPHEFVAGTVLNNGQGLINVLPLSGTGYTFYMLDWSSGFWDWNVFRLFPFGLIACVVYMISMIAETNRAPFDLPEAETELVAGFHTEYSGFRFGAFFMSEYANMAIVSTICVTLFFGGWLAPLGILNQVPISWIQALTQTPDSWVPWWANLINSLISALWIILKLFTLISMFILVRASYPRLRYDMLMRFGWKGLLPVALVNLVLIAISLAVQHSFRDSLGTAGAWWVGQIIAWALMLAAMLVAFVSVRKSYASRQRDIASGEIPADSPIVRHPVALALPALTSTEK